MATSPALPLTDVLRALADAGASDNLLGQVVRELVVSKTPLAPLAAGAAAAQAAALPATPAALQPAPAPSPAGLDAGTAPFPETASPAPPPQRFSGSVTMAAEPVVVNFRKNGKRSSVYFTPAKWMELVAEVGNEATTLDLVKQYAAISPDQGNRSAWVQEAVRRSGGMAPRIS
jgi:hypothetical protein